MSTVISNASKQAIIKAAAAAQSHSKNGPSSIALLFRMIGDILHIISIVLLGLKIQRTRSCAGLSLKSQSLYMIVYITRYLDVFRLPRLTILSLYNFVMKMIFLGTQGAMLYFLYMRYKPTYNAKLDNFRQIYLIAPCAIIPFICFIFGDYHRLNGVFEMFREYMWIFSLFLESVAIFPQLILLQNAGEAESITSHYLLCLGLYRLFYLFNWIARYAFETRGPDGISVLTGIIQSGLYSDFFYLYYKKVFAGRAFKLPI